MAVMTKAELAELIRDVDGETQLHLLDEFDSLSSEDQQRLGAQIQRLFRRGTVGPSAVFNESLIMSREPPQGIAPPRHSDVTNLEHGSAHRQEVYGKGLKFIASGKAAVIVLAGGSGTRLGVSYPKGMLECPDLAIKKSLFQLQCEKVARAQAVTGCPAIPLCYMTSPATDELTKTFFEQHNFFGLLRTQVFFFCQSTMPCYTETGRIILATPSTIAEAPGGNAGIYGALGDSGLLRTLVDLGVEACQVVTVDNILAQLVDPIFFGLAATGVDVAVKTVPKLHDHEAVGVFARRSYPVGAVAVAPAGRPNSGLWGVVEYTEIGSELAAAVDEHGHRVYNCANIGIHLFSTKFLITAATAMKRFSYYHIARKPIPSTVAGRFGGDEKSGTVKGIKLEAFIFDLFLLVDPTPEKGAFALLMADRAEEFSAIKNADDPVAVTKGAAVKKDSPQSAVADVRHLHGAWLAGALVVHSRREALHRLTDAQILVEISPLVAALGPQDLAHVLNDKDLLDRLERALAHCTPGGVVTLEAEHGTVSVATHGGSAAVAPAAAAH